MRLTYAELEKLKKQYNVDTLFSYSRIGAYHTSPYGYYLKYILKVKETVKDSIYTYSGTAAHSILEQLYEDKIKYEDMASLFDDELLKFDITGLKFNRTDDEKNEKIKNKYNDCLKHFFRNHVKIPGKTTVEDFVHCVIDGCVFQGYIDLTSVTQEDDKEITTIYDFKTSTKFTPKDMVEKSGQLFLYALGLQQKGIPLENIRIAYDFLKYTTITYTLKNGKIKHQDVERNELGSKLCTSAKTKLKDAGYSDDQIQGYLEDLSFTNNIKCLPEEIQNQYEISDCITYVDLNQETMDNFIKTMSETLKEIIDLENKTRILLSNQPLDIVVGDEGNHYILCGKKDAETLWYDSIELLKKNEYYHFNLSGYTREQHKPWDLYLKMLEEKEKHKNDAFYEEPKTLVGYVPNLDNANDEEDDLFSDDFELDLGFLDDETSKQPKTANDDDLSWLDDFE